MFVIPEEDRAGFFAALEERKKAYDPAWKCPRSYQGPASYHTRLAFCKVHSTLAAAEFALALFDSGTLEDLNLGCEVLEHFLSLQDTDMTSDTFGLWSHLMEEPFPRMCHPDWNWADFCGKTLLQIWMHHRERLPDTLNEKLAAGIRYAVLSIFRRNMHSHYTNISIMGSYAAICAGEQLGLPDMLEYGKRRFRKFYDFTMRYSVFAEYNSPTYTVEAIRDLSRFSTDVRDANVRRLAQELADIGWRTAAEHYHAPTGQWCGPTARAYTWLLSDETKSFLQRGLGGRVQLLPPEKVVFQPALLHISLHCPEKYDTLFTSCPTRDVNLGFSPFDVTVPVEQRTGRSDEPNCTVQCHIEEDYAFSYFVFQDTWNQRRNLQAYWGGKNTVFSDVSLLHDYYDFSSGMLASAAKDGFALTAASLCTDMGDTHCNLEMVKNATVTARDLRLRVEFGGALTEKPRLLDDRTAAVSAGGKVYTVRLVGGSFDGRALALSLTDSDADEALQQEMGQLQRRCEARKEHREYVDVVFYHGEERQLDLSALRDAWAVLALALRDTRAEAESSCAVSDGIVSAEASLDGITLSVKSPERPGKKQDWKAQSTVNGEDQMKKYCGSEYGHTC